MNAPMRAADPHLEVVRAVVAEQLQRSPASVDVMRSWRDLGLDSLGTVRLAAALSEKLGRPVPTATIWSHPTVASLASALAGDAARSSLPTPPPGHAAVGEAIAIVGMGCRLPGANNPSELWELLVRGDDKTAEIPQARWDVDRFSKAAGPQGRARIVTRRGAFLDDVAGFDPAFFGVSPREAAQMDPQQRLALELAWEALEDAGIAPSSLREAQVGVFAGVFFNDYDTLRRRTGLGAIDQYSTTGTCFSFVANRISYTLGLRGPSLAVDSACSASLVAIHLACQSLVSHETSLALAGGVHLVLAPETMVAVSALGALSPSGRCYTLDARANGYARGEGGGIVVLKRLADALRDGDLVYATIRGSAVNNDGPSNGLTAPSAIAQAAVIREACVRAGVAPQTVRYVELHGTGTPLGDPIEAEALGAVYGRSREGSEPLLVGSLKTNVGHLEAAAGIAGLMKAALVLRHGMIPPSLHYATPNPHIDMHRLALRVVVSSVPLPREGDAPGRVGVSSFGLGGTNAHAILEAPPARAELLPLAADSEEGLADAAARARVFLGKLVLRSACLRDELRSFVGTSAQGTHRLAVTGQHPAEMLAGLDAFARDGLAPSAFSGRGPRPPLVFLYSGMGSQWHGMGRGLVAREPVFRAALEECDAALRAMAPSSISIFDLLFDDGPAARLRDSDAHAAYNPAVVAIQIANTALFRSWGIEPDAVIGHCIGEVAAAQAAGVLCLKDAMAVIASIGRAYQETVLHGGGLAAFVSCPMGSLREIVERTQGRVAIACLNDDESAVISGDAAPVRRIVTALEAEGAFCRLLSNVLTHCPQVEPFLAALPRELAAIAPRTAQVLMISTTLGTPVRGPELDGLYWARNIREPVRFAQGVRWLLDRGFATVLELGAHGIFARTLASIARSSGRPMSVVRAQSREADGQRKAVDALAELHALGVSPSLGAETLGGGERHGDRARLLVLSGRSEGALLGSAARHCDLLARGGVSLEDVCATAARHRDHHAHRIGVVATSREEAVARLSAAAAGRAGPGISCGKGTSGARPVFVFGGHGSQWSGMARELLDESVFRDTVQRCHDGMARLDGFDLLAWLSAPASGSAPLEEDVAALQRVIFAMQMGLAAVWRSWGVEPAAVVGHSLGEIAAAVVAGALDFEDGIRVVCTRSRLIAEHARGRAGGMLAVSLSPEDAARWIADEHGLSIAVINGPRSVVLSGPRAALDGLRGRLVGAAVNAQLVPMAFAAHGADMDSVAATLLTELSGLRPRKESCLLVSTVTGAAMEGTALSAEYWARNVRDPVRFASATTTLLAAGHRHFLEVGGQPVLGGVLREALDGHGEGGAVVATLRRNQGGQAALLDALAKLYCAGAAAADGWRRGRPYERVTLPLYAWQKIPCWLSAVRQDGARDHEFDSEAAAHDDSQMSPVRDWFYEIHWKEEEAAPAPSDLEGRGAWMLIGDQTGVAAGLGAALEALGTPCVIVPGAAARQPDALVRGMVRAAAMHQAGLARVVHLGALDVAAPDGADGTMASGIESACESPVAIVAAMSSHERARLVFVTRGAVGAGAPVDGSGALQSMLWGLGCVAALENPAHRIKLIDIDPRPSSLDSAALLDAIAVSGDEDQIALRAGRRYVARLSRATLSASNPVSEMGLALAKDGVYVVTGGLGGIGRAVAQRLAARGAGTLVLSGRKGAAPADEPWLASLRATGTAVHVQRGDVARRDDVRRLLAAARQHGSLRGIFHAAGVIERESLLRLHREALDRVLGPKVRGAWALHELTLGDSLDHFVCFSSIAAVWGARHHGAYATANAAMDGLVRHRVDAGLPGLSIQWGAWTTGMATPAIQEALRRSGVRAMPTGDALA